MLLESTLPICMLTCHETKTVCSIDKIVTICSALGNCCDSVVNHNFEYTYSTCICSFKLCKYTANKNMKFIYYISFFWAYFSV